MNKVILAIIGSRNFTDYEFLRAQVYQFLSELNFNPDNQTLIIVSGGAKGADTLGKIFGLYPSNRI